MSAPAAASDPGRYHATSAIRRFLAAAGRGVEARDLLQAAVHERWAVKTAADPDAQAMADQVPTEGTIQGLSALPVPPLLPPDGRSDGAEKTVWSLTATLTAYRAEADGDYHLVIADDAGRTMIAEIPKPADIAGPSHFSEAIADARRSFDEHFQITENPGQPTPPDVKLSRYHEVNVPVRLVGLGFFDFAHNQRGVAPNAIELHPVVNMVFMPNR